MSNASISSLMSKTSRLLMACRTTLRVPVTLQLSQQRNRTSTPRSIAEEVTSLLRRTSKPMPTLTEEEREDFFEIQNLFTIEDMMEARVHFGHKEALYNPYMRPYIFGKRLGVLIFDLDISAQRLNKALNVAARIAYRDGIILFVNTSRQTGRLVEKAAKDCGEYAYCRQWSSQVFTNAHAKFGAVIRLPDLVIMFTTVEEMNRPHRAVNASASLMIPTIGICDTNSNPTLVTYPVPGNDDSPESIEFYANLFKKVILRSKEKKKEILENYGEDFYIKTLDL